MKPEEQEKKDGCAGTNKILIMDDDQDVREVLGEMLSALGYQACYASDGMEAVQLYADSLERGKSMSAVILDLTVPGKMSGEEAAVRLREMDRSAVLIAASGYLAPDEAQNKLRHIFDAFLSKPFLLDELARVLQTTLSPGAGKRPAGE